MKNNNKINSENMIAKKYVVISCVIYLTYLSYMFVKTFIADSLEQGIVEDVISFFSGLYCVSTIFPNLIYFSYKILHSKRRVNRMDYLLIFLTFIWLYSYLFISEFSWITD